MYWNFSPPWRSPKNRPLSFRLPLVLLFLPVVLWGMVVSPPDAGAVFSGYVLDSESGEGLPGANVFFKQTDIGTATNIDGYFVLPAVPAGNYQLSITFVGYATHSEAITIHDNAAIRRNFELSQQNIELQSVEVSGERIERKLNIQLSRVKLGVRQLKSVPQLGEADLFRTLQSLPGVLTESDFSTGLVIRGGNTDQNLILLDGITVYNPSHVGGLFSNFIVDAVKEADLMKGGFNAEYGGRLSAVLNVRSREGNRKKFSGKSSVSLLSAQTTLEGPVGKGAWVASGRRTYFDKVFEGTKLEFPYYFWDVQGHVFQDLSENDRVSVSWYAGTDDLYWGELQLRGKWGNETASINYRKLFNQQLISNWMVAKSRFDILFGLGGKSGIKEEDYIDDVTFRSDWTYFLNQRTQLRFGAEYKDLDFVYQATGFGEQFFKSITQTVESAAYLKFKHWLTPKFLIEPGYRLGYYGNSETNIFHDPRLMMKYLLSDTRYINASVGKYHQFMMTIQDDFNPKVLDAWFAVDESVEPASANQFILGYEEYFPGDHRLQVEVFYKQMENILTFVDNRSTVDDSISSTYLDSLVDVGSGYAYGGEIFFQRMVGRLNGWIAYSWSVARKELNGKEYFTNWDRTHAFNIIASYRLNRKWSVSTKWTYQTGQPYTPILGYYGEHLPGGSFAGINYQTIPGGRNSARYPEYHRLDLGAVRRFKFRETVSGEFFIQVVNVYWRKNVFRFIYEFGDTQNGLDDDGDWSVFKHDTNKNGQPDPGEPNVDEADEGAPQRRRVNGLPIIPTIGISIAF